MLLHRCNVSKCIKIDDSWLLFVPYLRDFSAAQQSIYELYSHENAVACFVSLASSMAARFFYIFEFSRHKKQYRVSKKGLSVIIWLFYYYEFLKSKLKST
jgi:hypothetical protein